MKSERCSFLVIAVQDVALSGIWAGEYKSLLSEILRLDLC